MDFFTQFLFEEEILNRDSYSTENDQNENDHKKYDLDDVDDSNNESYTPISNNIDIKKPNEPLLINILDCLDLDGIERSDGILFI